MNSATRTNVATLGVILGLSGMAHGFAETLQGNNPTGGMLIHAIAAGSSWTRWSAGGEAAFTLIPNFLLTGILAMLVGLAVIVWSLGFVHSRYGASIFLLLFVLLFLVGGGIGQVAFFSPAWLVATRIHTPLNWWRDTVPANMRRMLALAWSRLLSVASVLLLAGLILSFFGYLPGIQGMERVLAIMLSLVGASLLGFLLAFAAGFAWDIEHTKEQIGRLMECAA